MPKDITPTNIYIDIAWRPNSPYHRAIKCATTAAISHVNNDTSVLESTILHGRLRGTNCSKESAAQVALDLLTDSAIVIVGAACSGSSMAMAPILAHGNSEHLHPQLRIVAIAMSLMAVAGTIKQC